MPHKLRKTRNKRGSRTCGYGQVGQHRRSGTKGRKKSSFDKGGWTYITKYKPGYFGKKGFTSRRSVHQKATVINVGALEDLAKRLAAEERLPKRDEKNLLDLEALGYDKLLARGKIRKPVLVKISFYSKIASKKIEEVGGQILKQTE